MSLNNRWVFLLRFLMLGTSLCGAFALAAQPGPRWWKGNLHTHSMWSDGDDFPEMVADWYKSQGYDFLAISDHNTLQEGNAWIVATNHTRAFLALPRYLHRFGSNWVERAEHQGRPYVRLKTLAEYRGMLEAPGRFLLLQAQEVTDHFGKWPVHLIASNLREKLKPQSGNSITEVMQRNIDALAEQRRKTGDPMMIHLAHPNFGWGVTAEDMMPLRGDRFFEVYNGHPQVNNEGDQFHAGTERMWDILNTHRLEKPGAQPLLGLAVDDAHHYREFRTQHSNPGRGWVMVRAGELQTDKLLAALESGDFYATSGVTLNDVVWTNNQLTVRVQPDADTSYTIEFIGTRRPVDFQSRPVLNAKGHPLATTRLYSTGIGAMLARHQGLTASYSCQGDELYVRAKITSSRPKKNAVVEEERECAWTQPFQPKR